MNIVILIGNLTKDPAFFKQEKGDYVAKFDIATEYGFDVEEKKQKVEFVPITAFGISESFKSYLKKGRKVSVQGRVGTDSYEKEGQKVWATTVKVFNGSLRLIDPPKKEEVQEENPA
jgi:single-strand DNA-binding protein